MLGDSFVAALVALSMGIAPISTLGYATPPTPRPVLNTYSSDWFSPEETLAASTIALIGRPTPTGTSDDLGQPNYRVNVERVLFNIARTSLPDTIVVSGTILPLTGEHSVLLALIPSYARPTAFRVTTRVSGVGFVRGDQLEFRSMDTRLVRYSITVGSRVGCFAANSSADCRRALLRQFGVRSNRERIAYDDFLNTRPGVGALWVRAYRKTRTAFPDRLCSSPWMTNCASVAVFSKEAGIQVTM